jgi:hypothetical protein
MTKRSFPRLSGVPRLFIGGLAATAALTVPAAAYAGEAAVSPVPVGPGGTIEVVAQCSVKATSASISAAMLGGASSVPMTSSSQNPGDWIVRLKVPADVDPGTYELGGTCSEGDGFTATVVIATHTEPASGSGWAMAGPNETLLVSGSGLLLAAVTGGFLLLRGRRPVPARVRRHGRS